LYWLCQVVVVFATTFKTTGKSLGLLVGCWLEGKRSFKAAFFSFKKNTEKSFYLNTERFKVK